MYKRQILGTVGRIPDYTDEWEDRGYLMDDTIGLSGAEAAFEDYLRGTDGKRMISVNSDGKITGEYYSVEPVSYTHLGPSAAATWPSSSQTVRETGCPA